MSFEQFLFYMFSAGLIGAALAVISVRNPVYAALFLILAFFNSACLWMLLEAEFLAIVLVLVYVGAVMVLFLFVVMMLDINVAPLKEGFIRYLPVGLLVAATVAIQMGIMVGGKYFGLDQMADPSPKPADYNNTAELGNVLYTVHMYAFEIAAVILLVAIVAAIALTMRKRPETRYQNPHEQINVKAADRVRIVRMKPENRP